MDGQETDVPVNKPSAIHQFLTKIGNIYQFYLDQSVPHVAARWSVLAVLVLAYIIRIVIVPGWYIVTYGLGIYLLNLFLGFLTPKVDPALEGSNDDDEPGLPTKQNDEFRPFIRRLPEFKFWLAATKAFMYALFFSSFEMFDIPVFWPILVVYFIILFVVTMKKQIKHMWKYKYFPWTMGKKTYQGRPEK